MASTSQQDPDLGYLSPILSLSLSDLESNNSFASVATDDLFKRFYGDTDASTPATDDGGAGTTGGASFCSRFFSPEYKTVEELRKEITDRRSTGNVTDAEANEIIESDESDDGPMGARISSSSTEANDIIECDESDDGPMGARIFREDNFEELSDSFEYRIRSVSFDEYWCGVEEGALWTRKKNQTEQEEKDVYSNYSCSSKGKFINIISRSMLNECIKSALPVVSCCSSNILIQFWAPVVTSRGGQCVLTTRNLPFILGRNEGRLIEYRKHSISRQINVNLNLDDDDDDDDDDEEEFGGGGVIGRVFRHKQMETTPDVSYYSTEEYPQRDIALKFDIKSSLALPVFHPFDGSCYGVLELVSSYNDSNQEDLIHFFTDLRLYEEKNKIKRWYSEAFLLHEKQIEQYANEEIQEINKALQLVCTTHKLPLAQIWIPGRPRLARTCVDSSKKSCHLYCSNEFSTVFQDDDDNVGMILLNHICISTYLTMGQGIVGKALLYGKPYFCRDVSQLPITEYALSHYMREYGLTGCFAICIHGSPTKDHDYVLEFFLPPCNTISEDPQTFLKPILATAKRHLRGFEIYSGEGPIEELHVEIITVSVNDEPDNVRIPKSLQNEREEVQKKVTSETVIEDGLNDEISLSLEDLKQHLGKKLNDVAKSLGVSRSTVKRACRSHGIKKWPFRKRKKVNQYHPLSNPKQAEAAAAAAAAQTIQDVTKSQDFGTVKAEYRGAVIKFKLSFSSGIAELVENVTKRLPLTSGSFSMRYADDEGELVLIACDEDLNDCLVGWLSLPDKKPIRIFIDDESIINQAP